MGRKLVGDFKMTKTVEFYFDVGSPTAYLAYKRLLQLNEQYKCSIKYHPILLGGIFKATGNNSPIMVPAKGRYMDMDMPRYAKMYGVPLKMNPHFPINTLNLMRGAIAALDTDYFQIYLEAVFNAIWIDGKDMGDLDIVTSVLSSAGLDASIILELTQDPKIKDKLISNTEWAVERGLFGAPTMFIGGEMFFGQDRLHFIEAELKK
jgi:2-hydroxychromene-2-carboxylate isomerase